MASGFFEFTGKTVCVMGAGNVGTGIGNGKAIALLMARRGANVFAVDINPAAVAETEAMIRAEGGVVETHVADATSSDSVAEALASCVARFGGLDIMVNNVGGSAPGGAASMPEELWDKQIEFNLKSAWLGCHHAIPLMLERGGGAIINVASIVALRMGPGRPLVAYASAKHGVIALSKSIAIEQAKNGIRCNTVIPGLINTPLVEARLAVQAGGVDLETLTNRRNAQVPMGRMGSCWDVANAALFLASDEAGYITGTELVVDGGIAAAMM